MSGFSNDDYRVLATDLINDAFYLDERSKRGAIATIRTYTEVVIRRILDIPSSKQVTIGNKKIINALKVKSNNDVILMNAIGKINKIGNYATHSQIEHPITESDFD